MLRGCVGEAASADTGDTKWVNPGIFLFASSSIESIVISLLAAPESNTGKGEENAGKKSDDAEIEGLEDAREQFVESDGEKLLSHSPTKLANLLSSRIRSSLKSLDTKGSLLYPSLLTMPGIPSP